MSDLRTWARRARYGAAALLAAAALSAAAETPQEFAARASAHQGVRASVGLRDDGAFGSLDVALSPQLVGERAALDAVLAEIGRYAAAAGLRVFVVAPNQADADHMAGRLRAAGVDKPSVQRMAEGTSNTTSRIFLTPGAAGR